MSSRSTLSPRVGVAEHSWRSIRELQSKASSLESPHRAPAPTHCPRAKGAGVCVHQLPSVTDWGLFQEH